MDVPELVCAVDSSSLHVDPWTTVIFSAPSLKNALYFLRSMVEEPALHVYSDLSVGTAKAVMRCMWFIVPAGKVVELNVEVHRLVMANTEICACRANTYAARFQCSEPGEEETEYAVTLVHQLARRVQQCAWASELAAVSPSPASSTRPCT